jgi:hypothetical protein
LNVLAVAVAAVLVVDPVEIDQAAVLVVVDRMHIGYLRPLI